MPPHHLSGLGFQAKYPVRVSGVAHCIDSPIAHRKGGEPSADGRFPKLFWPPGGPLRLPALLRRNAVQVRPTPAGPINRARRECAKRDQSQDCRCRNESHAAQLIHPRQRCQPGEPWTAADLFNPFNSFNSLGCGSAVLRPSVVALNCYNSGKCNFV